MVQDSKVVIGIDNGVSGALSILGKNYCYFTLSKAYIKKEKSYTKKDQNITRIDVNKLYKIIIENIKEEDLKNTVAILERPLVNPTRFKTTQSAMRCLEATLIVLEYLNIPIAYCDSKEWQHKLFSAEDRLNYDTKELSRKVSKELYPQYSEIIDKQDGDALLIANWYLNKK